MSTSDAYKVITSCTETAFYPLNLARVLMQIGYEPLEPYKGTNMLGREQIYLPNTFVYINHLRSKVGITGLYSGFGMKMLSNTLGGIVYMKVKNFYDEDEEALEIEMRNNQTESEFEFFTRKTSKEINIKCWAILMTHPLHVMALRCMSQLVGGEAKYSSWNLVKNSLEIYRGEGLSGFFSGLLPRLLFEASTIAVMNGLTYLTRKYLFDESDMDKLIEIFSMFIAHTVTYPMSVVTTVSCVSGSALTATNVPNMPDYRSWIEVFNHLYKTNGFIRGSTSFFRGQRLPIQNSEMP